VRLKLIAGPVRLTSPRTNFPDVSEIGPPSARNSFCACHLRRGILCAGGFIQAHAAASTVTFLRFGRLRRKQWFYCIGAGACYNQEAKFLSDARGGSLLAAI
jgi:hypothetical protein